VASFSTTQVTVINGAGANVQYLYDGTQRTLQRLAGGARIHSLTAGVRDLPCSELPVLGAAPCQRRAFAQRPEKDAGPRVQRQRIDAAPGFEIDQLRATPLLRPQQFRADGGTESDAARRAEAIGRALDEISLAPAPRTSALK
jgi:hypothetical protein